MRYLFPVPVVLAVIAAPACPSGPSVNPLAVIHDGGGVPLAPYLDAFTNDTIQDRSVPLPPRQPVQPQQLFPVVSTKAGPGRLLQNPMPSKLSGGPGQPIFIVGDDPPSHEWLRRNGPSLQQMGAKGIVAAVQAPEALFRLRASADLHMVPMSVDALLEAAGIHVWPVLIGPDGSISQ